jgi:hypothetical protein
MKWVRQILVQLCHMKINFNVFGIFEIETCWWQNTCNMRLFSLYAFTDIWGQTPSKFTFLFRISLSLYRAIGWRCSTCGFLCFLDCSSVPMFPHEGFGIYIIPTWRLRIIDLTGRSCHIAKSHVKSLGFQVFCIEELGWILKLAVVTFCNKKLLSSKHRAI